MKIGILTLHSQINYGGVLQAYALQRFLQDRGYDVEVIDYWLSPTNHFLYGFWLADIKPRWFRVLRFPYWCLRDGFVCSEIRRRRRTIRFLHEDVKLSARPYRTPSELVTLKGYDMVVVGSDQVWHPLHISTPNPFLLNWLTQTNGKPKKVAYAASFGTDTLPSARLQGYREGLQAFDAISVREEEGRQLVQQVANRDAVRVLDPSLLLSKEGWQRLAQDERHVSRLPYIFCYWLGDLDRLLPLLKSLVRSGKRIVFLTEWRGGRAKFRMNLHVRQFLLTHRFIQCRLDAGPKEFVQLLANSEAVLSDSFHAMMFGTIFEKPMCIVHKSSQAREPMGARLWNFQDTYGLGNVVRSHIPTGGAKDLFSSPGSDRLLVCEVARSQTWVCRQVEQAGLDSAEPEKDSCE